MTIDDRCGIALVRVRYADTDQMGVAYNGAYFTWFEIGRTELLRHSSMTYNEIEKRGYMLPVIESGIKFIKPAKYDDVLSIATTLERQQGIRVRFSYEICRDRVLLATGFTEHAFTDMSLKPTRPPKELSDLRSFINGNKGEESHQRMML